MLQGLGVGCRKIARKLAFHRKKIKITFKKYFRIYLLVIPKYRGKQIFTHGRFPEVGQKQKTGGKEKKSESLYF